jgi:hypothetical protein
VTAVLCAVYKTVPDAFRIGTDGNGDDWKAGVDLFNQACGSTLDVNKLPWV